MKKLFIFFLVCALFILQACVEDVLTKVPTDEVSTETYWKTENDLASWVNSLYDMTSSSGKYTIQVKGWMISDILLGYGVDRTNTQGWYNQLFKDWRSDDYASTFTRAAGYMTLRTGNNVVTTHGWDQAYFGGWFWWLIRPINLFMENYDKAQIPDDVKNRYAGEVSMFRAWFYYDKVLHFGGVPLILKSLDIQDSAIYRGPRNTRDEVMEQVLEDINFACEKLPDNWNNGSPGYMNRWAALALKSRICLFEGTWRRYHNLSNAEMWLEEATFAAMEIMDGGEYSLYETGHPESDYRYTSHQVDMSNNPEVIYWKKYVAEINPQPVQAYFYSNAGGATRSAVEDFLCKDGNPISVSDLYMGDDSIESVFVNRDPRLRQCILNPEDAGPDKPLNFWNGSPVPQPRLVGMSGKPTTTTGYNVIKHYSNDAYLSWNGALEGSVIFGYNEVLLNYAEAKAELGTLTQADLDISINMLRNRAGMPDMELGNIPHDPKHEDQGVSDLIVEIRRERHVELFSEGFRYDDLRRWKTFVKECTKPGSYQGILWDDNAIERYQRATVQSSIDPVSGKTYIDVFKGTAYAGIKLVDDAAEKYYLWPIPQYAKTDNPELEQNPGWNWE